MEGIFTIYRGSEDIIANHVEHRAFVLLTNLITLEMYALFAPEKFKIDPYQIMLLPGGGLFKYYILPDGRATVFYRSMVKILHGIGKERKITDEPDSFESKYCEQARECLLKLKKVAKFSNRQRKV